MTTANPYTAPTATDIGDALFTTYQPRVFSFSGRIGRLRFLAYSLAWAIAAGVLASLVGFIMGLSGAIMLGFFMSMAIAMVPMFVLAVRRLNDLDVSGWWSLLVLVPVVNIGMLIYNLFWPGSADSNRYGPAPGANTVPVVIAALIGPVLGLIIAVAFLAAISIGSLDELNAGGFDFEQYAE